METSHLLKAPEPSQIVGVRQRQYFVEEVIPPGAGDDATLVRLSCLDDDAQGQPLEVLWEKEVDPEIITAEAWQGIAARGFDPPRLFSAYLHTLQWNCVTSTDPGLFQSPFRAGIRIDAYQLEPLRKALRLPRVNLFIADDVGLGKPIEAGLIAHELLLRKKAQDLVVACPPSMLLQWQDELETRFGMIFQILDKDYIARVRRERGYGINPWTTHTRFLVSHRSGSTSRPSTSSARARWTARRSGPRSSPRPPPCAAPRARSARSSTAARWTSSLPPGPDRRDSFFARTHTAAESHTRLYLGVAAQGRSLKVIMLRAYLALLGACQKAYVADGGKRNHANAADPYMTLLGYFNSLRELGGSRRIIEDEVTLRLRSYAARKRVGQKESPFADRDISYEVVELTSRVNTSRVADAKRRLALRFREDERVDVAIATNMISVGLDITRLGLMVVLGQPKTTAEYIQATSRVGRDADRPGLVVTLLNVHRHRDRSHYERFEVFHESFYRTVEATSVTPFSPRALDRGLAGTLVALARLGDEQMTPPRGAGDMLARRQPLEWVAKVLSDRAGEASVHVGDDPEAAETLRQHVKGRAHDLLDAWEQIAHDYRRDGTTLQYNPTEVGAAKPLLHPFLDPELKLLAPRHMKFRANRSMCDVKPSVNLWLRTLDDREIEAEEGPP